MNLQHLRLATMGHILSYLGAPDYQTHTCISPALLSLTCFLNIDAKTGRPENHISAPKHSKKGGEGTLMLTFTVQRLWAALLWKQPIMGVLRNWGYALKPSG